MSFRMMEYFAYHRSGLCVALNDELLTLSIMEAVALFVEEALRGRRDPTEQSLRGEGNQ